MEHLGFKATDLITGFTGIITGYCLYLSGCNQCLLTPQSTKDGAFREAQWFDVQRVKVDSMSKPVRLDNGSTPGFDKPAPKR